MSAIEYSKMSAYESAYFAKEDKLLFEPLYIIWCNTILEARSLRAWCKQQRISCSPLHLHEYITCIGKEEDLTAILLRWTNESTISYDLVDSPDEFVF